MNLERYTEKARDAVQAAQTFALSQNHQKLLPDHLLSVILSDNDHLAETLIRYANGNPDVVRSENDVVHTEHFMC